MKAGDLVSFVGAARFYKERIGVVCRLYSTRGLRKNGMEVPNSALVYYPGAERQGRCEMAHTESGDDSLDKRSGLHPMALDELEVIQ